MNNQVTERQVSFINTLQTERNVPSNVIEFMRNLWRNGMFDTVMANTYIQVLQKFPEIEENVEKNEALVGMHGLGHAAYRVRRSKSGCLYTDKLIVGADGRMKFSSVSNNVLKDFNQNTFLSEVAKNRVEKTIRVHNLRAQLN